MERFASTETLMKLLESGEYKRLVMENEDEDFSEPEKIFENIFENYKAYTSRPDNYDYFSRRKINPNKDGNSK
jgi:hypothetical protein